MAIPNSWAENWCAGVDRLVEFRKRNQARAFRSPEATSLARGMSLNKQNVDIISNNLMTVSGTKDIPRQKAPKGLLENGSKQVGQFTTQERGSMSQWWK